LYNRYSFLGKEKRILVYLQFCAKIYTERINQKLMRLVTQVGRKWAEEIRGNYMLLGAYFSI
jgi:hypothetical protein